MTTLSVIEAAAAALGTDHLQVHVTNAWIVATPEASIIRSECIIEISDGRRAEHSA